MYKRQVGLDGVGQWGRVGPGLDRNFVSAARARVAAAVAGSPRVSVSSSSVPNAGALGVPPVASISDLSSNGIGTIGEDLSQRVLQANGDTFVDKAVITVRLSTGEVFDVVPDFLRLASTQGRTATLDIIESKASRVQLPDIAQLSDNQAVLLDALLRGDDITVTAGSRLQERLPNINDFRLGRFDIETFLLLD